MSTRLKLAHIAVRLFIPSFNDRFNDRLNDRLPIVHSQQELISNQSSLAQYPATPDPVVIDMPTPVRPVDTATLSNYLRLGRTYHPLCRHAFIEKRVTGYYHYEQRVQYSTCAVAAAYAGAFGPQAIERPDFSYSMALWRLSQKVGYDLNTHIVNGPTGRRQPVAEEMMQLVDENHWSREGLVEWLESLGL